MLNELKGAETVDIFDLLFSAWWYGREGRTRTADAADRWLLPLLLVACAGVVVMGLMVLGKR